MKFKSTWILIAVFAALGAYLYFVDEPGQRSAQRAKEREGLLFPDLDASRVTEIALEGKNGSIRVKRGENGHWSALEPVQDLGDDGKIRSFLEELKALKADKDVEKAGGDLKPFGLDTPEIVIKTQGQAVTLAVGSENPSGDSRYLRSGDGPVKIAKSYALAGLLVKPDDLRSREVLGGFPWADLKSVAVSAAKGSALKLSKVDGKWRLETPVAGEADPDAAEALAEKLRWAKIASFLPEDPANAEAKLAKGITVSLDAGGEASHAAVRLAEVDGAVWAQSQGRAALYTLDREILGALRVKPEALRRSKPVLTKTWSAEKLELASGESAVAYEKSEGAWRRKGETVRGPESAALQDLLQGLEESKAGQVIAAPAADAGYGLDAPRLTLKLSDSQHGEQMLLLGQKGSRVFARAGKSGPVYAMSADYLVKALALLQASANPTPPSDPGNPGAAPAAN